MVMSQGRLPLVSIVMPVRNEADFIGSSLAAVFAQNYPPELLEVIVADGRSSDLTRTVVRAWQAKYPQLKLVDNPGKVAPTGLNVAIAQAQGEVIVRVDGHCEIAPDYIRGCVDHLLSQGVDGVGGILKTVGQTVTAKAIAAAMSSKFGVGGSAFRTVSNKTMLTDTVAFPAYTRAIIDRAGPFDEELVRNQDDEYNYRLRKMGAKILLASDIQAIYYSRASMRRLWQQYFQYGFWKVRVMQKHPRQMRPRQFAPSVLVLSLSLAFAAGLVLERWWPFIGVACAYFLANLAAAVVVARGQWFILPLLPVAFTGLHLSYGFGFLVGLCKFYKRWRT